VSVVRQPVRVSSSGSMDGSSGVTSLTAKRILEALESHSQVTTLLLCPSLVSLMVFSQIECYFEQ